MPDRHRGDRGDRGASVTEVVVTMAVFGVVCLLATQAHILLARGTAQAVGSAQSAAAVRLAIDSMERQVRSGNVLLAPAAGPAAAGCVTLGASGTCMRVYTQVDGRARCVEWQLAADPAAPASAALRTRSWSPRWSTDGDVDGWRAAATGLALPGASNRPFELRSAASFGARLLDVRITAPDPRRPGATTTVTTSLAGRNTTYGYDSSLCSAGPP